MPYTLDAACLCDTGKIRTNNEDNFFFDGRCLEEENIGLMHPILMTKPLYGETIVAIFDGMGGESYGECASFAAAEYMKKMTHRLKDFFIPERERLNRMCAQINEAVVAK